LLTIMYLALKRPLLAGLACLVSWSTAAQPPVSQGTALAAQREETVRIPAPGATMVATVMRPPGEDRRPLVVINHGSPADGSQRLTMARPRYPVLSSWFVERGYVVVLPQRRGYGQTGGSWAETYDSCESPDYYGAGLESASDIEAAIAFMHNQPFVAADRTIVVGESAGGWATIALSSLNPRGVAGMVNFAGGRGGQQTLPSGDIGNCAPDALVKAAARYGATARVPMLWIYTKNDSFFAPALARRMVDAYDAAGGHASLHALAAFGSDGHMLVSSNSGVAMWSRALANFLGGLK